MVPYIMPFQAFEIYFSYIHKYLQMLPEKMKWKAFAAVIGLYLCQLGIQALNYRINVIHINRKIKKREQKLNKLIYMLKSLKPPVDDTIPFLSYDDLSTKLQSGTLSPIAVLFAYQKQAVKVNTSLNGISDLIENDVQEQRKGHFILKNHRTQSITAYQQLKAKSRQSLMSILFQSLESRKSSLEDFGKEDSTYNHWYSYNLMQPAGASVSKQEAQENPLANKKSYQVSDKGLLHGIPISLTEVLQLQSKDSTAGMSCLIGVHAPDDAVVVKVLKAQGAIPFIRTNVPQIGLHSIASSNPIFGVTRNPLKSSRSPGGTSSGEGSLLASKGSILGVGSDIAGGIRIPAHFCGVCGLKPTSGRISDKGLTNVAQGQDKILPCIGPLSRNVVGLVEFMRAVCIPLQSELDPAIPLLPFKDEVYLSKEPLRVGFFIHDGYTKCVPAVQRAVMLAKSFLEKRGHTVVEFPPPDMKVVLTELFLPTILGNNMSDIHYHLHTDKVDSSIASSYYSLLVHYPVRYVASYFYTLMGNPMDAAITAIKYPETVFDWWKLMESIRALKYTFVQKWRNEDIDVLLCPVLPFTALKLGHEHHFTAGTIPICNVEKADLDALKDEKLYPIATALEKNIRQDQLAAEPNDTIGLPVGVQVAALPFQEEIVLRILKDLESQLNGDKMIKQGLASPSISPKMMLSNTSIPPQNTPSPKLPVMPTKMKLEVLGISNISFEGIYHLHTWNQMQRKTLEPDMKQTSMADSE